MPVQDATGLCNRHVNTSDCIGVRQAQRPVSRYAARVTQAAEQNPTWHSHIPEKYQFCPFEREEQCQFGGPRLLPHANHPRLDIV